MDHDDLFDWDICVDFAAYSVRPFDNIGPNDDDQHGGNIFGFRGFPFNHDDMFRQFDEAFNHMMKNFGAFSGHLPDQEHGIHLIDSAFIVVHITVLQNQWC